MIRGTTLVEARGLHSAAAARPSIVSGWVRARPDHGGPNRPALSVLSVVSGPWSVALEQQIKDNRQYSFSGDSGDGFGAGLLIELAPLLDSLDARRNAYYSPSTSFDFSLWAGLYHKQAECVNRTCDVP